MAPPAKPAGAPGDCYDIFLCTRSLPDKLTAETAALRQLCGALIGQGYRVFFPPAAPADKPPEEQAQDIAGALQDAPVMIAAAVGGEGARDETARALWGRFRALAQEDPSRCFIPCCREVEDPPEELQGPELLDMGGLDFLAKLEERLSAALRSPEPETEAAAAPESAGRRRPRWAWLALAAAAVALTALVIALCVK